MGDVIAVDLPQRRAEGVDAGAVLATPVGQQRADGMLFLTEGGDPLLLVSQETRQVAPVAVLRLAVRITPPEQQLLHFFSGVKREQQTGLLVYGDDCREEK